MHRCPTQSIATTNTTQQLRATRPARAPVVAPQRSADRPAFNHPSQPAPHRSAACPGSVPAPGPGSSAAAVGLPGLSGFLVGFCTPAAGAAANKATENGGENPKKRCSLFCSLSKFASTIGSTNFRSDRRNFERIKKKTI